MPLKGFTPEITNSEIGKLIGLEHGHQLGGVLDMHEYVVDPDRAVVAQPPIKAVRLAGHESDCNLEPALLLAAARG